ncbi:hypothetical protein M0802_006700 [Mischocyttarus mexicanus]|nr:hypothetical protein M0802_006700 [Mischocyttarus mexicanus]
MVCRSYQVSSSKMRTAFLFTLSPEHPSHPPADGGGLAAPRHGSQMKRFNEKMASRQKEEEVKGGGEEKVVVAKVEKKEEAERGLCFSSLIRKHCMSRGSNEIAAIKMMLVYMPRVLDTRKEDRGSRFTQYYYYY